MALTGTEHTYPPELRKELVKVFNRFDRDRRASGLKWMLAGATKPTTGRELSNAELAQALERSSAFTQAEWDAFGIRDLGPDDFIKVGQSYFTSTGSGLDAAELKAAFYVMGLQYTDEEIDLIMKEFDIDSSGTIELKEWEKLVYAGLKRKDADHALVASRQAAANRDLQGGPRYPENTLNGSHTYKYTIGTYTGQFRDGQRHGEGMFDFENFGIYHGSFVENNMEGHGVMELPKTGRYKEFSNCMHSENRSPEILADVVDKRYEGEWLDSKQHGHGTYTWTVGLFAGCKHEGQYVKGLKHGPGVFTWPDGSRYEGEFQHDSRTGHGVYTWPNGDVYEGWFQDGQKHTKKASGLKWERAGSMRPKKGRELTRPELQSALEKKAQLTQDEWNSCHVDDLSLSDFVCVGDCYFLPSSIDEKGYFLSAVTADGDRSIDYPIASWGGVEYPDVDLRRWSFQGTFANDKPIAGFLRSPCPLSAELNVSMRRKR